MTRPQLVQEAICIRPFFLSFNSVYTSRPYYHSYSLTCRPFYKHSPILSGCYSSGSPGDRETSLVIVTKGGEGPVSTPISPKKVITRCQSPDRATSNSFPRAS